MRENLSTCPFCNGEAIADFEFFGKNDANVRHFIICVSCGATSKKCNTPDDAYQQWEHRAGSQVKHQNKSLNLDCPAFGTV